MAAHASAVLMHGHIGQLPGGGVMSIWATCLSMYVVYDIFFNVLTLILLEVAIL